MKNTGIRKGIGEPLVVLSSKLTEYLKKFGNPVSEINIVRNKILNSCIGHSADPAGMFRLTVPTGGGKTLSSAAFAFQHAVVHGMRRIIYVIPYISIIRQTVDLFQKIFGEENVLAHYSTVEYNDGNSEQMDPRRLAAENWDAPIIVTTNVRFFECLYGAKPSKCRRIHNIANSVIIFDEAQMLPRGYLEPCMRAVTELCVNYHCSAVLCTATQPALDNIIPDSVHITELYPGTKELFDFFKRVTYRNIGIQSDDAVISQLSEIKQVLCIVNSRKAAKDYFQALPSEGRFHLSTYMYPAHIASVLELIKKRLQQKQVCRVVSTSLIEAGVDIDFSQVYREICGLDSIIQAGGRCNREGLNEASVSFVTVFTSGRKLHGILDTLKLFSERVMERHPDFSTPEAIKCYFEYLYKKTVGKNELDIKDIIQMLSDKNMAYKYRTAAQEFKMIETPTNQVLIPREKAGEEIAVALRSGIRSRELMQKTGAYSVSLYENQFRSLKDSGALEYSDEDNSISVLRDMDLYSDDTGIEVPENGTGIFS